MRYYEIDQKQFLPAHSVILQENINRVIAEGFIDNAKKYLGDKVNQTITSVNNATTVVQLLYKVTTIPQWLQTTSSLLRKSIRAILKTLPNSALKTIIVDKYNKNQNINLTSFFINIILLVVLKYFSKSFLMKRAQDDSQDVVKDSIDWKAVQEFLVGKITNIETWISQVGDATGIFTILKWLKIGNDLLFQTLTNIWNKIRSIPIGTSQLESHFPLKEDQVFDWNESRSEIMKYITAKLSNQQPLANPFYDLITNRPKTGSAQTIGLDNQFAQSWKGYFSQPPFDTDGVWSQININKQLTRKSGPNVTYNFYITVSKNRDNIAKFIHSIPKLYPILKQLSDQKQTPISFKTHRLLDAFVSHNDSLKIFYYDQDLKQDIEAAVKQWLQQTGIKTGARTHMHGIDKKGVNGGSYGQMLANIVAKQVDDIITKNGSKFTPEQYFAWIKQYMPQIIQSVQIAKQNS